MVIQMRVADASIRALTQAAGNVERARLLLEDRRQLLIDIREQQAEEWREDFESQQGGEWAETSPFQQARRVQEGYSPTPTLRRSGATFDWFNTQNMRGRVNAASITWNFQNREGAYTVSHHTGYTLGGSEVPARELWRLEAEDEDRIANDIEEWVASKLVSIF